MSLDSSSLNILVAHGVNLDLLGQRQPEIYGSTSLASINETIAAHSSKISECWDLAPCRLTFFQSNSEGDYLTMLSQGWDGALLNPGAWTHTSLALADRLAALRLPFVEVHLSNLAARESLRQHSYSAPLAVGVVYGFGAESYLSALYGLLGKLRTR